MKTGKRDGKEVKRREKNVKDEGDIYHRAKSSTCPCCSRRCIRPCTAHILRIVFFCVGGLAVESCCGGARTWGENFRLQELRAGELEGVRIVVNDELERSANLLGGCCGDGA